MFMQRIAFAILAVVGTGQAGIFAYSLLKGTYRHAEMYGNNVVGTCFILADYSDSVPITWAMGSENLPACYINDIKLLTPVIEKRL